MDRRFALFAVLVALIFVANQLIFSWLFPPPPAKPKAGDKQVAAAGQDKQENKADKGDNPEAEQPEVKAAPEEPAGEEPSGDEPSGDKPAEPQADEKPDDEAEAAPELPAQRGTLGSLDRASPYRMLVVWNNRGGAIECIELNSPRYRALDSRSGYLGYLAPTNAPKRGGAHVRVVGAGTPAAAAGIEPDDVITAIAGQRVRTVEEMLAALLETTPGQKVEIAVQRGDAENKLTATLAHRPLPLIEPEFENQPVTVVQPGDHDPFSFLTTIQQFDERALPLDDKNKELGGLALRTGTWEVAQATEDLVQFKRQLPKLGLEITKTFRLARVPKEEADNANYPAYGLTLELAIANVDDKPHEVAYRLDGPNGLPTEGAWYANKVSHTWSSAGLRDVIVQFNGGLLDQVSPSKLVKPDTKLGWGDTASLDYSAVDAQYFAVAAIPNKQQPTDIWFQSVMPIRVGAIPKEQRDLRLLNLSFRLDSKVTTLAPGGAPLKHEFTIFAGPKRPALLSQYGQPEQSLSNLVYYGWPVFAVFARLLSQVLHFFYMLVGNYGLAIVLLTVLVRGCMFPLSRKQAIGAQKMQELQPEMKRISEKYKNEPEKRTKATQELFRKHNYNPVGGCLLMFVQLPIFMGLYRSLMVNIELRQAPLFTESIRWASNLSAPDMLWNWQDVVPNFVVYGAGIFPALGPYLNILPLFTVVLFIWQQKMFMPPPADEQAAMQQKMMKYMMLFMGILFFKVASGLCVYFIASSLWGICERKLLPKSLPKSGTSGGDGGTAVTPAKPSSPAPTGGNGAPNGKKKRQRGRK